MVTTVTKTEKKIQNNKRTRVFIRFSIIHDQLNKVMEDLCGHLMDLSRQLSVTQSIYRKFIMFL